MNSFYQHHSWTFALEFLLTTSEDCLASRFHLATQQSAIFTSPMPAPATGRLFSPDFMLRLARPMYRKVAASKFSSWSHIQRATITADNLILGPMAIYIAAWAMEAPLATQTIMRKTPTYCWGNFSDSIPRAAYHPMPSRRQILSWEKRAIDPRSGRWVCGIHGDFPLIRQQVICICQTWENGRGRRSISWRQGRQGAKITAGAS